MAAAKGNKYSPGRPKGSIDKSTIMAREAIALFVEGNVDRLTTWLDQIADENPKDAFTAFMSVVEFYVPKLARSELTGKDGKDLTLEGLIAESMK